MGNGSSTAVGAGLGSAIGTVIPGIGTALGGFLGGVAGFFAGLFQSGYDVTASQLPPAWMNRIELHRSFDTQKKHDDYVTQVWSDYANQVGLSGSDVQYLQQQESVGTWAQQSFKAVGQIAPRHGPVATTRVYPGGASVGNSGVFGGQYGPQPTPPNTHFPGGTPLHHRRRRGHRRHARHASSHL